MGAAVALAGFGLGMVRQNREDRRQRARMGYDLTDALFDDPGAEELLMAIDDTAPSGHRRTSSHDQLARDFVARFSKTGALSQAGDRLVCSRLDNLCYYLDRFEHALQAGLTDFEAVRMPFGYYVKLLARFKPSLVEYIKGVENTRALSFLARYPEWEKPSHHRDGHAGKSRSTTRNNPSPSS